MRKHIRSIWARSNEHIRVKRGRQSAKQKSDKAPPVKVNTLYIIAVGYICWMLLYAAAAVLENALVFLVAALPWLALGGICGVIVRIIFGKSRVLKKR